MEQQGEPGGSLTFSQASASTKGVIYFVGTVVAAVGAVVIIDVIKTIYNVLMTFFATSETDRLAAQRARGGKAKKAAGTKPTGAKKQQHGSTAASKAEAAAAEAQQQAGQPGVSIKQLLKQAKTKPGTAAHITDKAPHHPLFIATLKGHSDAVTGLAFSRDSSALATACEDRVVRVFKTSDIPSRSFQSKRKALTTGLVDVAFGADASQIAVLTKGTLHAASLAMLSGPGLEQTWEVKNVLSKDPGMLLRGSTRGPVVLMTCSPSAAMAVVSGSGKVLAEIDTNGLKNHGASISPAGNLVAAAAFTADVKVHEVKMDRAGNFMGCSKVMDLKAHTSQVFAVDFSPCGKRMVTTSKDGTWGVWNVNVRYEQYEDPKTILMERLPLPKGSFFTKLCFGPHNVVAAACGGSIHFLDAATGQVLDVVEEAHEPAAGITKMAWTPDAVDVGGGQRAHVLATASADRRVRLWQCPVVDEE